ncbi:unnamed protein product [Aureobasidium uvarum]|uniref:RING-type domain-containing protein n=1 Tax=Aureobasidium uvarum TaxID=2773716 RepID=A0A9N8K7Q9_9PEZI|nr:unnamed protein product [Aureobasidium uvarum]
MPILKRDREAMDDDGARKKMKTSPADEPHIPHPVMDLTADEPQTLPGADIPPSQELQSLKTLRGDFDDIRQLITCKICERLLYEPYVISCGHTYCYSCLCTWLATNKKKTCPNCREVIKQPPAPSYVIREMINIFLRSHNLLPDGESLEQHQQWAFEEAEMVRNDRDNKDTKSGGLFKGIFRPRRARLLPIHDPTDHVDRCPRCHHEIEDGMCNNCGVHMDSWSTTDSESSSDMHGESIPDEFEDDDMDADADHGEFDIDFTPEDYEAWMREQDIMNQDWSDDSQEDPEAAAVRSELVRQMVNRQRYRQRFHRYHPDVVQNEAEDDLMSYGLDEEDEDEDDDEDAGSIDDFLDDRDVNEITTHTISSQTAEDPTPVRQRNRHHHRHHHHNEANHSNSDGSNSDSDSESDSDSDGVRHNPQFHRPRVPVFTIQSDDEEEFTVPVPPRRRRPQVLDRIEIDISDEEPVVAPSRRRRPARVVESEEESSGSSSESESESDDQAPRAFARFPRPRPNPPTLTHRQPRAIRVIDSDEDEVSNTSADDVQEEPASVDEADNYSVNTDEVQEGAGFSPLQQSGSEDDNENDDGGNQFATSYFNVYGDEDAEEDEDDEEEEEDEY